MWGMDIVMKKGLSLLLVLMMFCMVGCQNTSKVDTTVPSTVSATAANTEIKFIDDSGKEIVLSSPATKIVSLYSVHTENLFSFGLNEEIIGVGTSDSYPEEASKKTQYSFKDDPELLIAAKPDVVLVRTMIINSYPDYIKAIEDAGITVVNLYCTEFEQFDDYITRLGMLVGKNDEAKNLISKFHKSIDDMKAQCSKLETKKKVYFESIGDKFKTATPNSFAGTALQILGLENIASDVVFDGKATVVEYGEEALLAKGKDIDIYIAQKGTMNKAVSVDEIKVRPGYDAIRAVQENHIIIIDEKLISSATMRYIEGLKELYSQIYGK